MLWRCGRHQFDLSRRCLVMGVINVTPDSFSDGGRYFDAQVAADHGSRLAEQGADILDIGGESTRPGAPPVPLDEELRRVIPVIEALRARLPRHALSIDTAKAGVARAALAAGADIINDVTALTGDPAMLAVAAAADAGIVLMHMRGTPATMQQLTQYDDVVREVGEYLRERLRASTAAGIDAERVVLDPGIGFAKSFEQNLELFQRLAELCDLGRPLLIGASRKAFIGRLLGDAPPEARLEGTAAAVASAVLAGARIVRVHDVAAMARVVRVTEALRPRRAIRG